MTARSGGFNERQRGSLCVAAFGHVVVPRHDRHGCCGCYHLLRSGAAPTPLYHEYQEHFGLTAFMITIICAAYVLCLLLALLTVGSLSDYIGRRPAVLAALTLNVLAMILFITAGSAAALIVARAIQGFGTGLAITTLAAVALDTDKERAPVLNSFTVFAGLSAGTLGAGALVTFAPAPGQLVFVVLLVLSVVEAAILWFMPETATTKPGALASLRPRVDVPRVARATFAAVTPVTIASWSLGGSTSRQFRDKMASRIG